MANVVGICFNNGVQAIAKLIKEDDHYLYVDNLLAIQLDQSNQDAPKLFFQDMTPFAELGNTGMDTKIVRESVMHFFEPARSIVEGFDSRTSLIIKP